MMPKFIIKIIMKKSYLELNTNFDYKRINSLYSNLSSLNIYELFNQEKLENELFSY